MNATLNPSTFHSDTSEVNDRTHNWNAGPLYSSDGRFYKVHPTDNWTPAITDAALSLDPRKSRGVYIVLALLLGGLGIHNFYAGRFGTAIAQLLITLLTGWLIIPLFIVGVWALIDACAITTDGRGRPFA